MRVGKVLAKWLLVPFDTTKIELPTDCIDDDDDNDSKSTFSALLLSFDSLVFERYFRRAANDSVCARTN